MNKAHFLCVLLSVVLVSCLKKEANLPRKTSGAINTISVIIEDQLWNGEVGDSIRNKFASPVIGLPEEEPLFTINQFPIQLLEGFATTSRAIIIVKKAAENKFEIKKNQYASPQNVFHISGKTAVEILQLLEEHSPEIIRHIKQAEILESQRINQKALLPAGLFKKQFQLSIQVPSNFEQVMRKPNFVWFKKNSISGSSSLLLYQLPLNTIRTSAVSTAILSIRDSIGKYIQGAFSSADPTALTCYTQEANRLALLNSVETFQTVLKKQYDLEWQAIFEKIDTILKSHPHEEIQAYYDQCLEDYKHLKPYAFEQFADDLSNLYEDIL